ncbi:MULTISPECIES: hypothetical protein [Xanthomonas]|uniref:hypothetical protein n=1 Tax=Xanthomonas TaxID=338 RepID=UPI001AD9BCC7|nr:MULTISPECIES: hypothetical protein [unclassified Xanthomonas]MBO9872538.1 hypothetical protein [Xanthomonas sp. D-93]WNH46174.1 hypothetical protein PG878_06925 [Xanthomonas sp. A6251]
MKKTLAGLFSILFACSFFAKAEDTASVCNGCSNQALRFQAQDLGNGHHYFWDFTNRKLTHYLTQGITTPYAHVQKNSTSFASKISVTVIPLTSEDSQLLNYGLELYDATGTTDIRHTVVSDFDIPTASAQSKFRAASETTRKMTAFDAVTTPAYREAAININFNRNNLGFFYWAQDRTRVALSTLTNFVAITGLKTPFTIVNNIQFPDGSYFQVGWDFNARAYSYLKGSAHDAAGNRIPENTVDAGGGIGGSTNYVYLNTVTGVTTGGEMVDHLDALGVKWNTPPGVPVNQGFIIACSATPSGTMCTIQPLTR